jgi:TRAP-type C4-dicarboxylate transport system permease small subunit
LQKAIDFLCKITGPVNKVAAWAGMVCLAAMMFLTAADVILRKFFDKPILGSYELTQFLLAITVALGLAYCCTERGHVTLDIVTSHLKRRFRARINAIMGIFGLAVAVVILWQTFSYIFALRKSQLLSTVLLIPVYPFVAIVALGMLFFCLSLLLHLLEFIRDGAQK